MVSTSSWEEMRMKVKPFFETLVGALVHDCAFFQEVTKALCPIVARDALHEECHCSLVTSFLEGVGGIRVMVAED